MELLKHKIFAWVALGFYYRSNSVQNVLLKQEKVRSKIEITHNSDLTVPLILNSTESFNAVIHTIDFGYIADGSQHIGRFKMGVRYSFGRPNADNSTNMG